MEAFRERIGEKTFDRLMNEALIRSTGRTKERITKEAMSEAAMALIPGATAARPLRIGKGAAVEAIRQGSKRLGTETPWSWIRGVLRAPQKELDPIRTISVSPPSKDMLGKYFRELKEISLISHPKPKESTVWHELAHVRQRSPRKLDLKYELSKIEKLLDKAASKKVTRRDYYSFFNPLEIHARGMEKRMLKYKGRITQKQYDKTYTEEMDKAIEEAFDQAEVWGLIK